MIISELINQLLKFPNDATVLVQAAAQAPAALGITSPSPNASLMLFTVPHVRPWREPESGDLKDSQFAIICGEGLWITGQHIDEGWVKTEPPSTAHLHMGMSPEPSAPRYPQDDEPTAEPATRKAWQPDVDPRRGGGLLG